MVCWSAEDNSEYAAIRKARWRSSALQQGSSAWLACPQCWQLYVFSRRSVLIYFLRQPVCRYRFLQTPQTLITCICLAVMHCITCHRVSLESACECFYFVSKIYTWQPFGVGSTACLGSAVLRIWGRQRCVFGVGSAAHLGSAALRVWQTNELITEPPIIVITIIAVELANVTVVKPLRNIMRWQLQVIKNLIRINKAVSEQHTESVVVMGSGDG